MVKRNPRVAAMVAAVLAWAIVTPITWWDLRRRPANQVRGPKWLWRLASANLTGSVAYFLVGRRRSD